MLQKLRSRLYSEEKGFTLIELLVVILIIGILAAIALPAFLGQRTKGQDSRAKSDVRNAVSQIESCYTDRDTYVGCAATLTAAGVPAGTTITAAGADSFTLSSTSDSTNVFTITKASTGVTTRGCTIPAGNNAGAASIAMPRPPGIQW